MEIVFKYKLWIGSSIFLLLIIFIFLYTSNDKEIITAAPLTKVEAKTPIEEVYVYVDIKGAVNKPGVYKMKDTNRIIDVITASGGLTTKADTSITNLAYQVFDGMSFKIYTKTEVKKLVTVKPTTTICPTATNKTCITTTANSIEETTEESVSLISINTATKEQLDTLPGIGPSIADKIIAYRLDNGNFTTLEDLKNVNGIGDSVFAKIKDLITL